MNVMRNIRRLFTVILLVVAVAGLATGANVTGILIDKQCQATIVAGGQPAARAHTRECGLMPDCMAAGYAVFTPAGKVVSLDAAGNKLAVKSLQTSKKKNNLTVQVSGEVSGDNIKVATLKLLD
jgi:hypothetical protein